MRSRLQRSTRIRYCATGPTGRISLVRSLRALRVRISLAMESANSAINDCLSGSKRNGRRACIRRSAIVASIRFMFYNILHTIMKKLKIPANLTALAYNSIKQYILEGRLDENARLTEEFLS